MDRPILFSFMSDASSPEPGEPTPHCSFRLTSPRPKPYPPLRVLLRMPVPFNVRTLGFAFLSGSICSLPVGVLFALVWRPFIPSETVGGFYRITVAGAFLLLPFWSYFALRSQPILQDLGRNIFLLILIPTFLAADLLGVIW